MQGFHKQDRLLATLGDITNPAVPLDLLDGGIFFGLSQTLIEDAGRPGGLHLVRYEYRVAGGPDRKRDWFLRYEFNEDPRAIYGPDYAYAPAHAHVNALPNVALSLGRTALPDIHLPTRKLWLEEVLAAICTDLAMPRCEDGAKDPTPVITALARIQQQVARLAGHG